MILLAFTILHVLLSLAAIVAGFVVAYDFLNSKTSAGWTKLINGGAIIDHEAPRERRFVAVQK